MRLLRLHPSTADTGTDTHRRAYPLRAASSPPTQPSTYSNELKWPSRSLSARPTAYVCTAPGRIRPINRPTNTGRLNSDPFRPTPCMGAPVAIDIIHFSFEPFRTRPITSGGGEHHRASQLGDQLDCTTQGPHSKHPLSGNIAITGRRMSAGAGPSFSV